jgi:hypothetical protein
MELITEYRLFPIQHIQMGCAELETEGNAVVVQGTVFLTKAMQLSLVI